MAPKTTFLVTDVVSISGERVDFKGLDSYIRHSADNWAWCIGESTESVYNCEALEEAYQVWKKEATPEKTKPQPTMRDIKLAAAIFAIEGYCSTTPAAILPTSDADELLGAWNRWNKRLQDHYIPELVKALDELDP